MGEAVDRVGPWLRGVRWVGGILLRPSRALALLPPLAWAAAIWLASAYSGNLVTVRPTPLLKFLGNGVHAFEFGLLALLCVPVIPRRAAFKPRTDGRLREWANLRLAEALGILLVVLLYAIVDEAHQALVPGRVASLYDVLTDVVGAACVLSVVSLAGRSHATDRALLKRLGLCLVACGLAAGLSTFVDLSSKPSREGFGELCWPEVRRTRSYTR